MAYINEINKKVIINYPTSWSYKVIGKDKTQILSALNSFFSNRDFEQKISRKSTNSKYISLHISLTVYSEEERLSIFQAIKNMKAIDYVL